MTSPQVFAILLAHFCSAWGDYTLQSMLPTYMATIQNFDLTNVSIMKSSQPICDLFDPFGIRGRTL